MPTVTEVTERPILFSGPMVRAILEGRKTQTRRVIKPQPISQGMMSFGEAWKWNEGGEHWFSGVTAEQIKNPHYGLIKSLPCPYGVPGDRLWVRENLHKREGWPWEYGADNDPISVSKSDETAMLVWAHHKETSHCPSIHMPRWASRITLEIVNVRVERVQDITRDDAKAEGVPETWGDARLLWGDHAPSERANHIWDNATTVENFRWLWDSINSKRGFGWDKNPWVWVVEFKRLEGTNLKGRV